MTNNALPKKKKRYEPPSITSPESDSGRGSSFHPAGVTGCSYGNYGATCANGTEPQGSPASCNAGGSPSVLNCDTGTSAGNDCAAGTDAFTACSTGTSVQSDCTNGTTPLGANCTAGSSASSCGAGSSGGA